MAAPEVTAALKLRDDMSPGLHEAQGHVGAFSNFVSNAGATMVGFLGAQIVGNIGNFIKEAITARAAADALAAQTNAAIKSTGGVAGVTADHIDELANSIKRYSGVDDDAIKKGENLLLTFTDIRNAAGKGNDIFDQATKIMTDMSVALGTDASGSAIQLGKALNDPIQGISALTKVGVSFSDEQKKQIKNLQDGGNMMGAQRIILGELSREFGGSAAAMGKSSAGMLASAQNAISDMQKALGGVFLPLIGMVAPHISDIANAAADWLGANQPLIDQLSGFVGSILEPLFSLIGKGVGIVAEVIKNFSQFNRSLNEFTGGQALGNQLYGIMNAATGTVSEISPLVTAFEKLIDTVISHAVPIFNILHGIWQQNIMPALAQLREGLMKLEPRFTIMVEKIRPVIDVMLILTEQALKGVHWALTVLLPPAINLLLSLFDTVMIAVGVVMDTFMALWTLFDDLFHGRWGKLWDDVKAVFATAVGGIFSVLGSLVRGITTFFGQVVDNIVGTKGSIPLLWASIVQWFTNLPGAILNALGNLAGMLVQAGVDLVSGFLTGLATKWRELLNWLWQRVRDLPDVIKDFLGIHSESTVAREIGENFVGGLLSGITGSWPGLTSAVGGLSLGAPGGFSGGALGLGGGQGDAASSTPYVIVQVDGRQLAVAMAPYLVDEVRILTGLRQ